MRDSVPSASYSSVCNVLRQWNISLIPTYRVYRLYDNQLYSSVFIRGDILNIDTQDILNIDTRDIPSIAWY